MPRRNLLSLHEAIVIALVNTDKRSATFIEIAEFILARQLYPMRKGNIKLESQIMLRSTKSKGRYSHLFEQIDSDTIKLKNI
jgi:hypothetical protein